MECCRLVAKFQRGKRYLDRHRSYVRIVLRCVVHFNGIQGNARFVQLDQVGYLVLKHVEKFGMSKTEQHLGKVGTDFRMPFPVVEIRLEKAPQRLLDRFKVPLDVDVLRLLVQVELNVEI